MEETVQQEKFHHPKGLWLSCIGMCGSSFLKYAVSGFLIFFYTYSVGMGGLGLTKEQRQDLFYRYSVPLLQTDSWEFRRPYFSRSFYRVSLICSSFFLHRTYL